MVVDVDIRGLCLLVGHRGRCHVSCSHCRVDCCLESAYHAALRPRAFLMFFYVRHNAVNCQVFRGFGGFNSRHHVVKCQVLHGVYWFFTWDKT